MKMLYCKQQKRDLTPYSAEWDNHSELGYFDVKRKLQFSQFSFYQSGFLFARTTLSIYTQNNFVSD